MSAPEHDKRRPHAVGSAGGFETGMELRHSAYRGTKTVFQHPPAQPATQHAVAHNPLSEQSLVLSPEPIDGGWRAWSVLLGSMCTMIPTFGLMSTVGIFQVYWKQNQLQDCSNTEISWIISAFGFLTISLGAFFGALFDKYGSKWLMIPGAVVYALSFLGLAFCTNYWHFMVCFIVAGVGASILTTIALAVVNHWFVRRKGLAMGLTTMGAGVGGIFFSIVFKYTLQRLDWMTSSLILFSILATFLVIGCTLVEPRVLKPPQGKIFDATCFRRPAFILLTLSVCGFEMVLFVAWGLLPTYASTVKLGDVFWLTLVFSVGSSFGRIIPGYLTDKLGPFNVTIVMTIITLTTMLAIWLPFGEISAAALYISGFLLGFGTGSFVSTGATCIGHLCDTHESGTYIGSCYTVVSVATLISNPISQAILGDGLGGRTKWMIGFLSMLLSLALVSCLVVRWLCLGRHWRWAVKV